MVATFRGQAKYVLGYLAEIICRAGDESAAALFVLMGTFRPHR